MQVAELNIKIQSQVAAAVAGLNQTEKALDKVTTAAPRAAQSLATLSKASNQSQNAMQNLGRVLQDAPYGFIDIQNNLNPLLESFQRLKTESGSTGGALKALGSSLIGGGGVGLALSAVTALVTFATAGFGAWTRGLDSNSGSVAANAKKVEEVTTKYDLFVKELGKVTAAASEESAKVSILFGELSNSNTKLDQRASLISQLIDISPAYFRGLDKESSTYADIARSVDNYNKGLAKSAEIKALLPQYEQMFKKVIDAQVELNQLNRLKGGLFGLEGQDYEDEKKRLEGVIKGTQNELIVAKKFLSQLAGSATSLSEILFGKQNNGKPIKAKVDKIELDSNSVNIDNTRFLTKNKVKITVPIAFDPDIQNMQDAMDVLVNENNKRIADIVARNQEFTNNFRDTVLGLAETFANAFSQKNPLKSFLGGSLTMVGDFLQHLGKAALKASAVASALQKVMAAPQLSFVAGLAAIAIGGILKSAAPRFARGGGVTGGPQLSLIGDNPSGKEAVVPFERLGEFARAAGTLGGGGGILEARISGFDLLFLLNKTGRANNRQFGI